MAISPSARFRPPAGVAFEIAELVLLHTWAQGHGLVMEIALNEVRPDGEYEEIVLLCPKRGGSPRLRFWRNVEMVVMERGPGRVERFGFLSEALDHARLHDVGRV